MSCKETTAVSFENHMKQMHTLCGENAEILNVNVDGTHSYHYPLTHKRTVVSICKKNCNGDYFPKQH